MKFSLILAQFLSVISLAACGGGSGSPAPGAGPNPGNGKLNDTRQIIEYYGDSTIWGWESGSNNVRVATPAPEAFAAALQPRERHTVRNKGSNGTTVCNLLTGYGFEADWASQMNASDGTVVIVNHAINDVRQYGVTEYRNCLRQVVDIAQASGKIVILETPNPADDSNGGNTLAQFVQAMREIAMQKNTYLIDQYENLSNYMAAEGKSLNELCPDGIHPSQETYIRKGEFAAVRFMSFERR